MNDSGIAQSEGLVRTIGTRALGLNIINMVVGGGIFVLPGLIAVQLGRQDASDYRSYLHLCHS